MVDSTFNDNHQLTNDKKFSYTYDNNGNLIKRVNLSTNEVRSARQCLQERHEERAMNQRNCGGGGFAQGGPGESKFVSDRFDVPDTEASQAFYSDHARCFLGCGRNAENHYNKHGPDLPDNDPRIF